MWVNRDELTVDYVIDALADAGLDAVAVSKNPMCVTLLSGVMQGEGTLSGFIANVKKVAILNPSLRRTKTEIKTVSVTTARLEK